jgi:DNA repair protein RadC
MKNKTCANVGEDGKAVTELRANEATAALKVKRSRVPLYRIVLDRTGSIAKEGTAVVACGIEAAKLFREFLGDVPEEHFLLMVLDSRRRVIGMSEVSVGTLSASLVHPREVFRAAILLNGAAVLVCHNHPSGDSSPSSEDRDVTRRLQRAGELLGIPVADHIVLGEDREDGRGFFSFREHGIL